MPPDISQAQEALFTEWRNHLRQGFKQEPQYFYSDGLAKNSVYWETRPRVLFLLKEVNADKDHPDWNLFDVVGEGTIGPTWTVISYWTHGIHGGGLSWAQVPEATIDSRRQAIAKIAVVNLNKRGGSASSIEGTLWAAAYRDREFLIRQIRLYEPDIIIACGVGDIAKHILFEEHWAPWERARSGMEWMRPSALNAVLVRGYHPQARRSHKELYEYVIQGLVEIKALPPIRKAT